MATATALVRNNVLWWENYREKQMYLREIKVA